VKNTRYHHIAPVIALLGLLGACSDEKPAALEPGAQLPIEEVSVSTGFRLFLDDSYAEDMRLFPATASRRGYHDNDRQWNPMGESFFDEYRALEEQRLLTLEQFDRSQLSTGEDLSWQLYQQQLLRSIAGDNYRHHQYPISQLRGPHTAVPTYLINMHPVHSPADAGNYIARLRSASDYLDQTREQMQLGADDKVYLPDWSYPQMIATVRNTISGAPFDDGEDSAIWADIKAKISALDIPAEQAQALQLEAKQALLQSLAPAYERLIADMERLGAEAPAEDGVWKMPNGDAFYSERLNYFTTTNLSAEEIHNIGLREVARIHTEMRAIMQQVEFEGSLQEFFVFMREDHRFYYPDTEEGRARYLADATALIDTMRTALPKAFGIFPRADLVVKRVEPFREQAAGKAFYQYPAADGSRPGYYYANLYDMKSMPSYQMEALAYHEGIPGHHMQRAITVELADVPEFQKFTSFTAYTEGWGLYSEMTPKEMGFYTDPYSDFGRLAMELWRACRLVVDTGLHHKRWSREEAIDYLVENTSNSVYDSTKAIERYVVMPGQATAYMVGKLKILEIRERARTALGEKFDIREFHDEVLMDGQVPLSILEEKIDRWVERVKAS
jgi:uncharacterized protein (DUF885 family)